jgi:hypothetical protein
MSNVRFMTYLPGREGIVEEALVICALAQATFISPGNFSTLPNVQHLVANRAREALVENLLSVAIKTRFLDDQTGLLKAKDRRLLTIGRYFENGVANDKDICIRHALNKLVHYESIQVSVSPRTSVVTPTAATTPASVRLIAPGVHHTESVIVTVEGAYKKQNWRFEIDLFALMNEVLLVLE